MSGKIATGADAEMLDLSAHRFSALIFDCDGTLAYTAPHHFRSLRTAFAEQGLQIERDWYFGRLGLSRSDLFNEFEAEFNANIDRALAVSRSEEVYGDGEVAIAELPRVAELARHFRGRIPISVASGGPRRLVHHTLHSCGLFPLFDHIVTFDDVGEGKPSPALFIEAARRMGVPQVDCLVFEDSDEGLEAAKRAGMQAIDVRLA